MNKAQRNQESLARDTRNNHCKGGLSMIQEGVNSLRMGSRPLLNQVPDKLAVKVYSGFGKLPVPVLNAMRLVEAESIEQGRDWYANFSQTIDPEAQNISIYVLEVDAQVKAVFPVRIARDRFNVRIEALGNFYTSLYNPFVADYLSVGELACLIREMLAAAPGACRFQLSPMSPESPAYQLLVAAMPLAGLAGKQYFCFGNWYHPAELDWSGYLAQRPSQVKNTIKRKSKEFLKANGKLELIAATDRIEFGIDAYQRVYNASWKVPEPYPLFIPGLLRMLARNGWLRLGVALLDDQPIAAQIWIVAYGKASIFKLAYDEQYKSYSSGTLLTAMLMAHVIDVDHVREIDYLIGDDPYKATWMTKRRERWGLVAYNLKTTRGLFGWAREVLVALIKPVLAKVGQRSRPANG